MGCLTSTERDGLRDLRNENQRLRMDRDLNHVVVKLAAGARIELIDDVLKGLAQGQTVLLGSCCDNVRSGQPIGNARRTKSA